MYKSLDKALMHAASTRAKATVYTDASGEFYVEDGFLTTREALPRQIALLFHVAPGVLRDALTQDQVRHAAQPIAEKNRGRFTCGLVGHSLLVRIEKKDGEESRFCSRCGDPVLPMQGQVQLGMNTRACREAFKALGWKHKVYGVYEPFGPKYRVNNY